jgi:hypothetical protein
MTKKLLSAIAIALVLGHAGTTLAQSTAPATTSNDPVVQLREAQRTANAAYVSALLAAYDERHKKKSAAVEAAMKDADAKGKDPLVAKRDADAKAHKATQGEYDAALKKAGDERRAALDSADKKFKAAGK